MKRNYWSRASTDKNYIFDCLVSGVVNFNKNLEIKIVKNIDCLYSIKRKPTIFDFTFQYCNNNEFINQSISLDDTIKILHDNYTPVFLLQEVRKKYIETGVLDFEEVIDVGIATPVLKKLLPDKYSKRKNYKWVLNNEIDLTDLTIKNVFVIDIFNNKKLESYKEKTDIINKAMIFLDENNL